MYREIVLGEHTVPYTLRLSRRARVVNITLHADGSVVVSLPEKKPEKEAETFLLEKKDWILSHLKDIEKQDIVLLPNHRGKQLEFLKEYARIFVERKIREYNAHYGFRIGKVSVKNQKSQWGSCTARGNLNFSYKLVLLPIHLAEYVIVHELCHLKEFNHTKAFWDLVGEQMPKCKALDKELRRYHLR